MSSFSLSTGSKKKKKKQQILAGNAFATAAPAKGNGNGSGSGGRDEIVGFSQGKGQGTIKKKALVIKMRDGQPWHEGGGAKAKERKDVGVTGARATGSVSGDADLEEAAVAALLSEAAGGVHKGVGASSETGKGAAAAEDDRHGDGEGDEEESDLIKDLRRKQRASKAKVGKALLMKNRVPNADSVPESERLKHDLSYRPKSLDPSEDYVAVPVEDFGMGLLRGMLKRGENLKTASSNGKARPKPYQPAVRGRGLGLGAEKAPDIVQMAMREQEEERANRSATGGGKSSAMAALEAESKRRAEVARSKEAAAQERKRLEAARPLQPGALVAVALACWNKLPAQAKVKVKVKPEPGTTTTTPSSSSTSTSDFRKYRVAVLPSAAAAAAAALPSRGRAGAGAKTPEGFFGGADGGPGPLMQLARVVQSENVPGLERAVVSADGRGKLGGPRTATVPKKRLLEMDEAVLMQREPSLEGKVPPRPRSRGKQEEAEAEDKDSSSSSSSSSASVSSSVAAAAAGAGRKRKRQEVHGASSSSSSSSSSESSAKRKKASSSTSGDRPWVVSGIMVRVVSKSKSLAGGRYYGAKAVVVDVPSPSACTLRFESDGKLLESVPLIALSTALCKPGGAVHVLRVSSGGSGGQVPPRLRGRVGRLLKRSNKRGKADVQFFADDSGGAGEIVKGLRYEDVAAWTGAKTF